jgi:hypothetical protein
MNYASLEDAYGGAFPRRLPVQQARKDVTDKAAPAFTSLASRAEENIQRNKDLVETVGRSANIDETPPAEGFAVRMPAPVKERMRVRETFTSPQATLENDTEKISRILRLIEQNKTGYERPATQDMVLYIFTGVFFLFTFDTFVMLGKSMRGK